MGMDEKTTRWDPRGDVGCQENWSTLWKKLVQMSFRMRKMVRMLKSFLFGIVIQINHVVEADESKHFMLANYWTDYNTTQRSLLSHKCSLQYTVEIIHT